jgi:hypothetical protein
MAQTKKPPKTLDATPIPPPLRPDGTDALLTDEQKRFAELIGKPRPDAPAKPRKQ